eukprot:TRINITY_DN3359_c0_g1_i4.p1 TRINITY_DN3359_c0_g1~~TRINITY_DN3359_c0_g1_i4.p1  ORF type:complete len:532 (+),score=131.31 TRINITY_DN3359_c0_g1_i4:443-2038(+)
MSSTTQATPNLVTSTIESPSGHLITLHLREPTKQQLPLSESAEVRDSRSASGSRRRNSMKKRPSLPGSADPITTPFCYISNLRADAPIAKLITLVQDKGGKVVAHHFGENQTFGYVQLEKPEAAATAIHALNGTSFHGSQLRMESCDRMTPGIEYPKAYSTTTPSSQTSSLPLQPPNIAGPLYVSVSLLPPATQGAVGVVSEKVAPASLAKTDQGEKPGRGERKERAPKTEKAPRGEKGEKVDKAEKSGKVEKAEKIEVSVKAERNERADKVEKADRQPRQEKGEKAEKAERVNSTKSDSAIVVEDAPVEKSNTIFLKNIPHATRQDALVRFLSERGPQPVSVNIRNEQQQSNVVFAFAKYASIEDAIVAFESLKDAQFGSKKIKAEWKKKGKATNKAPEVTTIEGLEQLLSKLSEFNLSNETTIEFSGLLSQQRKGLHEAADSMKLHHRSKGDGADRVLLISKSPIPADPIAKRSPSESTRNVPEGPQPQRPERQTEIRTLVQASFIPNKLPKGPDGTIGFSHFPRTISS